MQVGSSKNICSKKVIKFKKLKTKLILIIYHIICIYIDIFREKIVCTLLDLIILPRGRGLLLSKSRYLRT